MAHQKVGSDSESSDYSDFCHQWVYSIVGLRVVNVGLVER